MAGARPTATAKHAWTGPLVPEQEVTSVIEEMSRAHGSENVDEQRGTKHPVKNVEFMSAGNSSPSDAEALSESLVFTPVVGDSAEIAAPTLPEQASLEMQHLVMTMEELLVRHVQEAQQLFQRQHQSAVEVLRRCAGLRNPSMISTRLTGGKDHAVCSLQPKSVMSSKLAAAVAQAAEDAEGGKKLGPLSQAALARKSARARTLPNSDQSKIKTSDRLFTGCMPSAPLETGAKDNGNELPSLPAQRVDEPHPLGSGVGPEATTADGNRVPSKQMAAEQGHHIPGLPTQLEVDPHIANVLARHSKSIEDNFQVLELWMRKKSRKKNPGAVRLRSSGGSSGGGSETAASDIDRTSDRTSGTTRCIVHPYDWRRGLWDIASLFLVIHDMAFIPLQFFEPEETVFTKTMAWLTRIFWTIDMPASFFTGYVTVDGFIELRLDRIASRYVYSWFALDCMIVSIDWMELVIYQNNRMGLARMGKATRTFRIIRMLRLLRLARMRQVMVVLTERLRSEKVVVIFDIIRLVVIMISFAHFVACFWYGVGVGHGELGATTSWVYNAQLQNLGLEERYAVALHWSIAQFAGGMDEVTPEHYSERLYAIFAFLFGFVVAAWFVSSLTSSMTQLNIIGSDKTQQLSALRVYLNQNGITHKLALRVQRNAQHALVEQQRAMPESNVELLQLVSVPLQVEIHLEMYTPHLSIHPFFQEYIEAVPQVMRKVCHIGAQMLSISSGDVVFSAGEIPSEPKMFIVCNGVLVYNRGFEEVQVAERQWIAEPVIWTEWVHLGDLISTGDCRLCSLDAAVFQRLAQNFDHASCMLDPAEYAAQFVKTLNSIKGTELSDLGFECSVVDGVRSRMSRRSSRRASHALAAEHLEILKANMPNSKSSRMRRAKDYLESFFKREQTDGSEGSDSS